MNKFLNFYKKNKGFSLVEILVSVVIFSMILLAIISFLFSMSSSNSKTKYDRDAMENARNVLDAISYQVRSAKSIYTPTTTATQLSLETLKNLPDGEDVTFVDFFLCGTAVCYKNELRETVALTSSSVQVTNLLFSQIINGSSQSVKIDLTVRSGSTNDSSSVSLTSTSSLRSY